MQFFYSIGPKIGTFIKPTEHGLMWVVWVVHLHWSEEACWALSINTRLGNQNTHYYTTIYTFPQKEA